MINQALGALKKYFGYQSFRKGQEIIIEHILKEEDVLGIMPTAAGKSICYQIPALVKNGVTIVISPLISLMKDQVDSLSQMGVQAAFINSSLSTSEFRNIMINARGGLYKLIYVAPERLENESFMELIKSISVSLVAVDEAHCVSQWGHDFRPSYRGIPNMIQQLPKRPAIAAFTATATPEVKNDIIKLLELKDPFTLINGFDRENLYFEVQKPENKLDYIFKYLEDNKENSGIIYASTRKSVETLYEKLKKKGYKVGKYHGGLSDDERTKNQENFLNDRLQVIVATNAFGMGIDKSNIRFVIHYNMPKNMEGYYQEAGRAGRDGLESECILLFGPSDIITNKLLIESGSSETKDKSGDYKKLNDMVDFCNTDRCLRAYILDYFGEEEQFQTCGKCGNCNSNVESTDITLESQKIMSCIKRMGERFGSDLIAEVLRGSGREKIIKMRFNELSTYGIMKDYSKETIKEIISFLIAHDYLALVGEKFPVIKLKSEAYNVLKGNHKVTIKRVISKGESKEKRKAKEEKAVDNSLFSILRSLRKDIASEEGVPPFVVFSDATLNDMCRKYPLSDKEMLDVSGVGNFKLEKYGRRFIDIISEYVQKNDINIKRNQPIEKAVPKLIERENNTFKGIGTENSSSKQADSDIERKEKGNKKNSREENEAKIPSKLITYELYSSGSSIEDIMKERQLSRETVEGHLLECYKDGLKLEYYNFVPKEYEGLIVDAIKNVGTAKLKPIKELLPSQVSYSAIKFVMHKYNLST